MERSAQHFEQPYPHLFSPITIRGVRVKNRVVSSPHSGGPNLYRAGDNGYSNFTETAAQYFGNIARGGAGIVHTGHLGVDPRFYLGSNCEAFNFFSKSDIHEHSLPVMHISDEIMVMYLGKCVEKAPAKELFKNPLHPYTRALLSAIPVPNLSRRGKERELLHGEVSSPIEPKPGCRFAPRCPYATASCTGADIPLAERGENHFVACRLAQ